MDLNQLIYVKLNFTARIDGNFYRFVSCWLNLLLRMKAVCTHTHNINANIHFFLLFNASFHRKYNPFFRICAFNLCKEKIGIFMGLRLFFFYLYSSVKLQLDKYSSAIKRHFLTNYGVKKEEKNVSG